MGDLLKAASGAITAAKSSPLALLALLIIVLAWVVIAFRVRRNSQLLANLGQLPEKDRLKALELEMGHVPLKGGLSPEQWLRARVHQYYFFGFALLCLFILILAAFAKYSKGPELKTGASISLHTERPGAPEPAAKPTSDSSPDAPSRGAASHSDGAVLPAKAPGAATRIGVETRWGPRQMSEDEVPADRRVTYAVEIEGGTQHIHYQAGYVDLFRNGGPIKGFNPLGTTFQWRYPEIAVNVVNNTNSTMALSQAVLSVDESTVEETPLLLVEDLSVNELIIRNEGWAGITGGAVELSIEEPAAAGEVQLFAPAKQTVPLPPFTATSHIALQPLLPQRLRNAGQVRVSGNISYTAGRTRASVKFETRVSLEVRAGAGIPASHTYQAFFPAGKAPVRIPIDIAQRIAPGEADRFYIVLGTDKTCHNRVRVDFQTAGGEPVSGSRFLLDVFVPRSAAEQDGR
jgi:hypothetical protein